MPRPPRNRRERLKGVSSRERTRLRSKAKALWDYNPTESNELPFKAGNIINVINMHNSDWYEGELNGKRGLFPANRVEVMKAPVTPPTNTKP